MTHDAPLGANTIGQPFAASEPISYALASDVPRGFDPATSQLVFRKMPDYAFALGTPEDRR